MAQMTQLTCLSLQVVVCEGQTTGGMPKYYFVARLFRLYEISYRLAEIWLVVIFLQKL